MPAYPPPRRFRTDNLARFHSRGVADTLLRALRPLRSKSGHWIDQDPESLEAWWSNVLHDPRARPSKEHRIPARDRNARQRLDRCSSEIMTVKCGSCGVHATYAVADLIKSFGADQNVVMLPAYLLSCKSKRDRRDGACDLQAEAGGYLANVRTVASLRPI